MKLRSLITPEMYQAIADLTHVTITPYKPRVRQVPRGALSPLYPLHEFKGDVDKVLPSRPPSSKTTNIDHVCQTAKTFGIRSNI